jgi:hypothetical protein
LQGDIAIVAADYHHPDKDLHELFERLGHVLFPTRTRVRPHVKAQFDQILL